METLQAITFEQIEHLLPDEVELYYIDYRDNLNNSANLMQQCLDEGSADEIYSYLDDFLVDAAGYDVHELRVDIEREFDIDSDMARRIISDNWDYIRDHYDYVDVSNPIKDLLLQTNLAARLVLHSNYDMINSHFFECSGEGYTYDNYFADMINALNLNPYKVKQYLNKNEIPCSGVFPNIKQRNGMEYVSYEDFIAEVENNVGGGVLTFLGIANGGDLYEAGFNPSKVVVPKGNKVGIFEPFSGSGSLMEMELLRDFEVEVNKPMASDYDVYRMIIDDVDKYGVKDVYGVNDSYFDDYLNFIK